MKPPSTFKKVFPFLFFFVLIFLRPGILLSQPRDTALTVSTLKKLSLEQLMEMDVISVSKKPEKITAVASAIQVITQDEIRRSGATNVAEALRLAGNLQVAQIRSNAWIIGSRGFNAPFSNKLQVMIDGRSAYSPLFAGVFWDAQTVLLEDIERIEVISGPGGTQWGANAVNGVINIITKNSKDTPGVFASFAAGNYMENSEALRFGGKAGKGFTYRVYGQRSDYSNTSMPNGSDINDRWNLAQGGFRMDWGLAKNTYTVQGNIYGGSQRTQPEKSPMNGQNLLGRFVHTFSSQSDLSIQVYFDRTWRKDIPSTITDQLETYDVDITHRFAAGKIHNLVWGAGFRHMHNKIINQTTFAGFLPLKRDLDLYSGFIQDEIQVIPFKLKFIIGSKVQHYTYSGFSFQPNIRATWTPGESHCIWAAFSRAIRAPSRIDVDYYLPTYPVPPGTLNVNGGPDFIPEKVVAWELGYRVSPIDKIFISFALFYNNYDDLYSVELLPGTATYQIQNGNEGYSDGLEISGTWQPARIWEFRASYTHFYKNLKNKPGHSSDYSALGNDPGNVIKFQSILDLPANFQFDMTGEYVSARPNPHVPEYFTLNARLGWTFKWLDLSINCQNILEKNHLEYANTMVPRNIYAKIACRF